MRKIYYSFLLCLSVGVSLAQAPFWLENFGTGCNTDQLADGFNPGQGTWSVTNTGFNNVLDNVFYISAEEGGMLAGTCGTNCAGSGNNRTLHISTNPSLLGDIGAAYAAGIGGESDKRAESPTINCTGQNSIRLSFTYILEGVPGSDYFDVHYYNGSTWTTIATPPQTINGGCAGQGMWTTYTVMLPASANNNPNVKVGFRWENTDATGADPGIAVDNVGLTALSNSFTATYSMQASICQGGSVNVVASTGTYVVSGYTWTSAPAANIASPNASATAITFTNTGVHSITLSAISGGTTATNVQTIMVNATPVLTVNASPASICGGQSSTLTVSGGSTYVWQPGGSTNSTVIITPSITTIYTVVGTSSAGCASTKTISINVGTQLSLTLAANPPTLCSGSSTTLTANGGLSYTWNPGAQSGSMIVSTPPLGTTAYTVNGVNGSCNGSAVITVTVTTCVGMQNFALSNLNFKLFPNPANDKLNIISATENLNSEVIIVDALGKEVSKQSYIFNSSAACTINVSTLPRGIYFVKISSEASVNVMRFIKE